MGKWATGVATTNASKRIELSYLLKHKFIVKGSKRKGSLSWTQYGEPSGEIGIETCYLGDGNDYIRLFYTVTINGVSTNYNYKIDLIEKASNLGKGNVLYFQCNFTGNNCRILYMAYDSMHFKSIKAYSKRLYYPIQTRSKKDRYNARFFELEKQIDERQNAKRKTYKYKEKLTKRFLQDDRLQDSYSRMDYLRLQILIGDLRKMGCKFDPES